MWRVRSPVKWEVTRLRMYADAACLDEVVGYPISAFNGCDGIADAQLDGGGKWCGDADMWLGLRSPGTVAVQCVHITPPDADDIPEVFGPLGKDATREEVSTLTLARMD